MEQLGENIPDRSYDRLLTTWSSTAELATFCNITLPCPVQAIANLEKKRVWHCNFGWLLVSQEKKGCYQFSMWEPKSSLKHLPPLILKEKEEIKFAKILSPPKDDKGCTVLLFESVFRNIIFCRLGDKQWRRIWVGKEIGMLGRADAGDGINCVAHSGGNLYAKTLRKGMLMVMEEKSPKNFKFRSLNCARPDTIPIAPLLCSKSYLFDFCGKLCYLDLSMKYGEKTNDVIDIELFKLESSGDRKEWIKMKSGVKDEAIFLSDDYAFSCPVNENEPGIQAGCVYFFRVEDKRLYTFNIEDQSLSVSLPLNLQKLPPHYSPFFPMTDIIRFGYPEAKSYEKVPKHDHVSTSGAQNRDSDYLSKLPRDTLEFIAKKLYPVDYIHFRAVCHTFQQVLPRTNWGSEASGASVKSEFPSLSPCPWLIFKSRDIHNFIDPYMGDKYLTNIPNSLLEAKIRCSKNGWLLMATGRETMSCITLLQSKRYNCQELDAVFVLVMCSHLHQLHLTLYWWGVTLIAYAIFVSPAVMDGMNMSAMIIFISNSKNDPMF